jgi:D-beta-D-heptose 7-phosphate kinase/D-beta-D-heptose 1-phosphate adenosyltransferase
MQLPDFSNSKILIIGDLMLDRYWSGATGRISPEAPVPVVNVKDAEDRPGGAANVAINAASLGARVSLLGLVGEDEAATTLVNRLNALDIDCQFEAVAGFDTITKLRIMSRNQQLLRLDFEKSFQAVDKKSLITRFKQLIGNVDLVVLSDYAKGCLSDPQSFIKIAAANNKPVIVDPKGDDFSKYRGATLITPNMSEFEQVAGKCETEAQLAIQANRFLQDLALNALLVTRSENGMSLFCKNELKQSADALHLPAQAKEVYDVTGAGDTVVSTLACALAVGTPLQFACQLANHAASVVVGKLGTSTVSNTELALSINAQAHIDGGVMSLERLLAEVKKSQQNGETVVMTNGCFDILHSGHVSYLTEAAKLGQRLIVAVNSDESVKRLKGEGRPINNASRRMAVLAGLSAVDWVIEFSDDTPQSLIAEILPDILVKGGDYQVHEIAGGKEVIESGGEVRVLNFEEGVSTTGIIKQIVFNNDKETD